MHYIGTLIVPQEFEKTTIKNSKLVSETIEVCGRKSELTFIRERTLQKHKKYMRIRTDEHYENMSKEDVLAAFQRLQIAMTDEKELEIHHEKLRK